MTDKTKQQVIQEIMNFLRNSTEDYGWNYKILKTRLCLSIGWGTHFMICIKDLDKLILKEGYWYKITSSKIYPMIITLRKPKYVVR